MLRGRGETIQLAALGGHDYRSRNPTLNYKTALAATECDTNRGCAANNEGRFVFTATFSGFIFF